jgi:hypothetical protein
VSNVDRFRQRVRPDQRLEGRVASRTSRTLATTRPLDESTDRQLAALVADPGRSSTTSAGGWSASSSRMPRTRKVLSASSGIVWPYRQASTVLLETAVFWRVA